ncbi:cytochrome P450 [Candidatus Bathyarchaeota archaeon]|nr:cytochrome P450 [Candidatus Bathyarchaeota archaeon]
MLTLDPPLFIPADGDELALPTVKSVDTLTFMEAVIMESLRPYPSVPGGQPRGVPKQCTLGGHDDIPAGTIVQCYAHALHRTLEIFPDPLEWKPKRWIESEEYYLRNMRRWF